MGCQECLEVFSLIAKELKKIFVVSMPMILAPLSSLLFLIIVAKGVDVKYFGDFSYVLVFFSLLVGFSDLGLKDYFLSKDGLLAGYASASCLLGVSSFVFLIILAIQVPLVIYGGGSFLLFAVLVLEAYALGVIHKSLYYSYQSDNRLTRFSALEVFVRPLPVLLKILIFLTFDNLVLALLVGSISSLVVYASWLGSFDFFSGLSKKNLIIDLKRVLLDWRGWGLYSISFFSFFLYFGADKLVIQWGLGAESLGVYSAAMAFMGVGQIAVSVLWSLYMPRLSRGEKIWSHRQQIFLMSCLGLLVSLVYQVFAYFFFSRIYPLGYDEGVIILSVASAYFVFRFPNVVMEIYYILDCKYVDFVKMRVSFGLLCLFLISVLLPLLGLKGAAISLVVAEMSLMFGLLLSRRRKFC